MGIPDGQAREYDAVARFSGRVAAYAYLDRRAPALLREASGDPRYQAMLAELLGRRLVRVYIDGRGIILRLPLRAPGRAR